MQQNGVFGRVNDSIRRLAAANDPGAQNWEFICECPDLACHTFVSLTVEEFDARRAASPPVPILAAEHEADGTPAVDASVSSWQRAGGTSGTSTTST